MLMSKSLIETCELISFPQIRDPRGNLTFIEGMNQVPFPIQRIFYLYDVPTAADRGAHAHYKLYQVLICLSGSFDVSLDDGRLKKIVHLNRPWIGLLIPPMVWAAEINFDPGTVCLVLASEKFSEDDYIREYDTFVKLSIKTSPK